VGGNLQLLTLQRLQSSVVEIARHRPSNSQRSCIASTNPAHFVFWVASFVDEPAFSF
jgi:hypothetical protein